MLNPGFKAIYKDYCCQVEADVSVRKAVRLEDHTQAVWLLGNAAPVVQLPILLQG